jgi:hypothetical protein
MNEAGRKPRALALQAGLPVATCRRLLGCDCTLTDEEIEVLRDELTILADAAIDALLEEHE